MTKTERDELRKDCEGNPNGGIEARDVLEILDALDEAERKLAEAEQAPAQSTTTNYTLPLP